VTTTTELCACGRPLHYSCPMTEYLVRAMITELGPDVPVTVGNRTWRVPRHFIALHGLNAADFPLLAAVNHFPEVAP